MYYIKNNQYIIKLLSKQRRETILSNSKKIFNK